MLFTRYDKIEKHYLMHTMIKGICWMMELARYLTYIILYSNYLCIYVY